MTEDGRLRVTAVALIPLFRFLALSILAPSVAWLRALRQQAGLAGCHGEGKSPGTWGSRKKKKKKKNRMPCRRIPTAQADAAARNELGGRLSLSLSVSRALSTPKTTRRLLRAAKRPIRNGDGFVREQTIAGEAPRATGTERPQVSSREWFGSFSRWLNCPFAQVREYLLGSHRPLPPHDTLSGGPAPVGQSWHTISAGPLPA